MLSFCSFCSLYSKTRSSGSRIRNSILLGLVAFNLFPATLPLGFAAANGANFFDLSAADLSGQKINFSTYRGKVIVVVNTASQCGFTPQLSALEALYKKYGSQGFVVLGFPSNDFKQEKGSANEIQSFANKEYGVTFPLFEKAPVSGPNKQPVYQFLTEKKPGLLFKDVSWNFEKFLVNRRGEVVERWSSITKPDSGAMIKSIEKALKDPL